MRISYGLISSEEPVGGFEDESGLGILGRSQDLSAVTLFDAVAARHYRNAPATCTAWLEIGWRFFVTLIVCLRAQGCVVFAADSLTSFGGQVRNCNTVKVHNLWGHALVAGCGWAGTAQRTWHDVFKGFVPPVNNGATPADSDAMLGVIRASLDGLVGVPPSNFHGACRGENTFLAAILDPASGDIAIDKFTRVGDRREFEPSVTASPPVDTDFIEFIGDTPHLQTHITTVTQNYFQCISNGMLQADAVTFARDAIKNAIPLARNAGVNTIGGDDINVLALSGSGVVTQQFASGVACP